MDVKQAIRIMADAAETQGGTASDDNGVVHAIVTTHGFSFEAWLCVCCELADRGACRRGFKDQFDQAIQSPRFQEALACYRAGAIHLTPESVSG